MAELEALDPAGGSIPGGKRRLLSLERAWTAALGNTIKVFVVDLDGAMELSACLARSQAGSINDCSAETDAVPKRLLLDLASLGLPLDNYEGMAIGPRLADGRRSLLLVNDNNFSVHQIGTQFILLALALED